MAPCQAPSRTPGPSPFPWHPREPAQVSHFQAVLVFFFFSPYCQFYLGSGLEATMVPGALTSLLFSPFFFLKKKRFQNGHYGPLFTMCNSVFNRFIHLKKAPHHKIQSVLMFKGKKKKTTPMKPKVIVLGKEVLYP